MDNLKYQNAWDELILHKKSAKESCLLIGMNEKTLELYKGFVNNHYSQALDKMFPRLQELISIDWDELSIMYYEKYPPYAWDLNDLTLSFPKFLRSIKDVLKIEESFIELVEYELLEFFVYKSKTEQMNNDLQLNPTTQFKEFSYAIGDWVAQMDELEVIGEMDKLKASRPKLEKNILFVTRNPHTNLCVFTKISPLIGVLFEIIQATDEYTAEALFSYAKDILPDETLNTLAINHKSIQVALDFMVKQSILIK